MKGHKAYTVPYSSRKFSKMMEMIRLQHMGKLTDTVFVFVDGDRLKQPGEKVHYKRCTWVQMSNIMQDLNLDIEDYSLKAAAGAWQADHRVNRIQRRLTQVLEILNMEVMRDAPGAKNTRELVTEALLFFMAVEPEDV